MVISQLSTLEIRLNNQMIPINWIWITQVCIFHFLLKFQAPELVFNQPYGKEIDFYSLGMILYNILLKKFPYDAKTREELKN